MIPPTYLPPIIQGNSDYRSYRPLLLDNGITVLLAHDPQAKHFAASVSVRAGASSDPRVLPGLAHFCEHMCFLGSKAYPEENEYKKYLAKHGGKSNASTSMSHVSNIVRSAWHYLFVLEFFLPTKSNARHRQHISKCHKHAQE